MVWVGFHGWAFDAGDAQMQAALAVRHSAIRAKVRHIPAATDAEMRPTDRLLLEPDKARRERGALLAKIDEAMPHMLDTRRTAVGGASPASGRAARGGRAARPLPRRTCLARTRLRVASPRRRRASTPAPVRGTKRKRSLFGR